jgi:hypothetical protein
VLHYSCVALQAHLLLLLQSAASFLSFACTTLLEPTKTPIAGMLSCVLDAFADCLNCFCVLLYCTHICRAAGLKFGYSALYYMNSSSQYVLATSAMHTDKGTLVVDIGIPRTDWLEGLRYDRRWLIDSRIAVTERMKMRGREYIMSARYLLWYMLCYCAVHPVSV